MQNRKRPDENLFYFRLVGAFSVTDAYGNTCTLPGRKDRAVLAFLAAHPDRPIARDRLVELIWPVSAEGTGRASLRQSLSMIRKALAHEGLFSVDRDTVTLNAASIRRDVDRIETGDFVGRETEVAPMANGEMFLDDLNGVSPEYDTWRATKQSQLSGLVAAFLITQSEGAEAAQDHQQSVSFLSQLVSLDPLNENAFRRLMQALILAGQPNAAVQRYRRFEALLDRELGIRPDPTTQDHFRRALAARSGLSGERPVETKVSPGPPAEVGAPPVILVRPFRDQSADRSDLYFADGLTEDITIEMGRFPGLSVMAPETGYAYRDSPADAHEIAREVGARYVLTGSVRRTPTRLRVSAQLLDADSRHLVWAERFDRDLSELFELQDDITASVVGAVAPQIDIAEEFRARRAEISSMSLYDQALKANHELGIGMRNADPDQVSRAISVAREILEKQPELPHALLVLAWGNFYCFLCRWPPDPEFAKAQALDAAERLLAVEPNNVHALTVRGEIEVSLGKYDEALRDYRRALDLNPNFTWALFFVSACEALMGRTQDAREHATRGLMLSPKGRDTGIATAYLGLALAGFSEGNLEDAVLWGERAIATQPNVPYRRLLVAACYGLKDELARGREHFQTLSEFAPGFISDFRSGRFQIFLDLRLDDLLRNGLERF